MQLGDFEQSLSCCWPLDVIISLNYRENHFWENCREITSFVILLIDYSWIFEGRPGDYLTERKTMQCTFPIIFWYLIVIICKSLRRLKMSFRKCASFTHPIIVAMLHGLKKSRTHFYPTILRERTYGAFFLFRVKVSEAI